MRLILNPVRPIWSDSCRSVRSKYGSPVGGHAVALAGVVGVEDAVARPVSWNSAFQSRSSSPVHQTPDAVGRAASRAGRRSRRSAPGCSGASTWRGSPPGPTIISPGPPSRRSSVMPSSSLSIPSVELPGRLQVGVAEVAGAAAVAGQVAPVPAVVPGVDQVDDLLAEASGRSRRCRRPTRRCRRRRAPSRRRPSPCRGRR